MEGGTQCRTCDFSKERPGQLGAWGWGLCKSFHGHSQHADITTADTTHERPPKVTTHSQQEGDESGDGNHEFCDMAEKTLPLRRGKTGCSWNRSFICKIY